MAPRWERVEEIFGELVDVPEGDRTAALARACAGDAELLAEVESLLAAHALAGGVLDSAPSAGASSLDVDGLEPGTRLGPWQVASLIGEGGSGEVYAAARVDGAFEQLVAIKVLRREAAAQLDRFHAERQILARLAHPGIARLLDGGVTPDGRPYAVIEYVEGTSLAEHCRERRYDLEQRLRLFGQVCDAVGYAHRHLVVHRDLKPGNILAGRDGRVKLLDFGIAKLLEDAGEGASGETTRAPLTPDYAAPEQLTGEPVTTATDVYALGVLLFELLTGTRPWHTADLPVARALKLLVDQPAPAASLVAVEAEDPPVPPRRLQGDLDAIVARCLRKEPAARYQTVEALWEDIERYLRHEPVLAREGARLYVLGRLLRRHRLAVGAAAALVLALTGGLAAFAWQARKTALERDIARRAASREEAVRYHLTSMFRSSLAEPSAEPITAKAMLDRSAKRVLEQYRDDPHLAGKVVETLADLYGALGDVEGQAPLLEAFLAAAGPEADAESVALARQKLAYIELLKGNPERAATLLGQAEAFWQTAPGEYREQRLEAMFVRGLLLRSQGDIDGSIATYRQAIAGRTALSGRAHRETANLYNSLAITLTAANRIDEALDAFRQSLAIQRELGRGDDLDALVMLGNTGTLAFRRGRIREAEEILGDAWRRQRAVAGDSAAVAASMGLYGAALTARGRAVEAVPLLREATAIAVKFSGSTSPLSVQDRLFLGEALGVAGEREEARHTLRENLDLARAQYGEAHVLTLRLRLALAKLDLLAGGAAAAERQLRELLPALEALGAPQASWLAHAQVALGEALLRQRRAEAAVAPLQQAVALRQKLLWAGSWELAEARARLGEALAASGGSGGDELLSGAASTLRTELGPAHPQTRRADEALASLRRAG